MARLSGQTYKEWVTAFVDAFDAPGDLEYIVMVARGKALARVAIGGNLEEEIERVIRTANKEGWLHALLAAARERQPGRKMLNDLSTELETMMLIEPDDPFLATRIFGEPMFDRDDLRGKLKALQTDQAAPVLLVYGDPLSGKTWSNRLIAYVAARLEDVHHIYVDLEGFVGKVVDAATLGRLIAEQTEFADPPSRGEEQASNWSDKYCSWLGRRATAAGGQWWLVVDHLQKVALHQDAADFLYALGSSIPMHMTPIRLIVLSYHDPRGLATGIGRIDWEKIACMQLGELQECLVTFFMVEYLQRERSAGRPRDDLALMQQAARSTQTVLANLADSGTGDILVQIGKAVRNELMPI